MSLKKNKNFSLQEICGCIVGTVFTVLLSWNHEIPYRTQVFWNKTENRVLSRKTNHAKPRHWTHRNQSRNRRRPLRLPISPDLRESASGSTANTYRNLWWFRFNQRHLVLPPDRVSLHLAEIKCEWSHSIESFIRGVHRRIGEPAVDQRDWCSVRLL